MELKEIRYENVDLIHLIQYRVKWVDIVNTVLNIRFP
jgi:hypothetical protein